MQTLAPTEDASGPPRAALARPAALYPRDAVERLAPAACAAATAMSAAARGMAGVQETVWARVAAALVSPALGRG